MPLPDPNFKKYTPRGHVLRLLTKGRASFRVVPFPRFDENGEPVAHVHVRLIGGDAEEKAMANATRECDRLLGKGSDGEQLKDGELRQNLFFRHVLADACRDPDDPTKPFFEDGIADVRQFNTEELSSLVTTYILVKEDAWPALKSMAEGEYERWVAIIAEGAMQSPLSLFSPGKLEVFVSSLAKDFVEAQARLMTLMSSFTKASASAPGDSLATSELGHDPPMPEASAG